MPEPRPLAVGLLGLGVVGGAVLSALSERGPEYRQRCGRPLRAAAVAVRDLSRPRDLPDCAPALTDDPLSLCQRADIDLIVELMGGEQPALDCIQAALAAGKSVITANKEVIAKHGPDLLALARRNGVELRYEASVGGGIPVIGVLQRDLQANAVQRLRAIINGTTNYMITAMSSDGASYDDALAEAQRLGYAEADPSSDVDGVDAAYKLAILASLAFHARIAPDQVYREGIRALDARDFRHAADLGYTIRMLATARRAQPGLDLRVHPTLIDARDPMAQVDGVLNAVAIEADPLGAIVLEGPGAGAGATASAVIGDLLDVAASSAAGQPLRAQPSLDEAPQITPIAEISQRAYLRLEVPDRAGVLAELGGIFAQHGVSIASVLQTPPPRRR